MLLPTAAYIHDPANPVPTGITDIKPLDAYIGKYYNAAKNFFIDILEAEDDALYVSFMGRKDYTFKLEPYQDDSFFWFLGHDEAARLARYDGYGEEFYMVRFGNVDDKDGPLNTLWWKHEVSLGGYGEAFKRQKQGEAEADEDITEL
ncbi:hypothetical protein FOFC_07419 [Fusarium oxysporum]|nr:hypothetical protein FOFC_07419 [Fusarium oxysporum]